MAQAIANEFDIDLIQMEGTDVISKWVGESSKNIEEMFAAAQRQAPAVLFIDEIDQIAGDRQQMHENHTSRERKAAVNELLQQMDRVKEDDVIVIGTTNVPDQVDPALDSRFSTTIEFDYPEVGLQVHLLKHHLKHGEDAELGAIDWDSVKESLQGSSPPFTHRDFEYISRNERVHPVASRLDRAVGVALALLRGLSEGEQPLEAVVTLAAVVDDLAVIQPLFGRLGNEGDALEGGRSVGLVGHGWRIRAGESVAVDNAPNRQRSVESGGTSNVLALCMYAYLGLVHGPESAESDGTGVLRQGFEPWSLP